MRDGYSVTVSKWGEPILTIEPNMLSGADLSDEDARNIRSAGEHLVSFAGSPDKQHTCFCCGETTRCDPDCPTLEQEPAD